MIFIGADHRGYEIKNKIINFLKENGLETKDLGAFEYNPNDDYNFSAISVAKEVQKNPDSKGILICGSAFGVTIQANRFKGIRAISSTNPEMIKLGREHNDANIICISADFTNEQTIKELITVFLNTDFSNEERHIRRINQLDNEENYA